jgi:replicative DNA helicase
LILLAARPSMGKTAMALNMGFHAAKVAQVADALFQHGATQGAVGAAPHGQRRSDQRLGRLRAARMETDEWKMLYGIEEKFEGTSFFIIDQPALSPLEIRAHARRLKSKHGIGLIILDYLQMAKDSKAKNREQEIGGISRSLKALAKELSIPVIALSQLNRDLEKRPNKQPILSDLRESGSLEQDADLVIFIYRDEVYNENTKDKGLAEIHLAKQRNGPVGRIKLVYRKEFMQFANYLKEVVV